MQINIWSGFSGIFRVREPYRVRFNRIELELSV